MLRRTLDNYNDVFLCVDMFTKMVRLKKESKGEFEHVYDLKGVINVKGNTMNPNQTIGTIPTMAMKMKTHLAFGCYILFKLCHRRKFRLLV